MSVAGATRGTVDEKISWSLKGTHLTLKVRKTKKLMIPLEWDSARSSYYVAELSPSSNLRMTPLAHAPLALLTSGNHRNCGFESVFN